jgi:hypothetical protein
VNLCEAVPVYLVIVSSVLPASAASEPGAAEALARLAVQRRDAARRTFETTWANYRDRRVSDDLLYRWSVRWLEAERQLSDKQTDQVAAFQAHLERMAELERLIRRVHRAGQATVDEVSGADFYRTEAELWLFQAKEKKR